MAKSIARFRGVCLTPGVSKNQRYYSRESIVDAVERAQARIDAGDEPITVLTHHGGGDDSTRIAGRLAKLSVDEAGVARYEAELADTDHARTLLNLIDTSDGAPFLKGVSIRGAWLGKVNRKVVDGQQVEYGESLELHGLDLTKTPGVPGAGIDSVTRTTEPPSESAEGRHLIYESAEALVTFTEETVAEVDDFKANTKPPGAQPSDYADPGYQADKKKRYLLDTKARAKAAWSFISQADNAKLYTGPQLKRIKQRIVKALKKFGVEVNTAEGYLVDPVGHIAESAELAEYYADGDPGMAGSFCVELCNGPLRISISSYCVDPADLDLIGRAAMDGAVLALKSIDPDMDADIDVPGADAEDADTGDDMESAPADGDALAETTDTSEPAAETPSTPEIPAEPDAPAGAPDDPAPEPAADQPQEEEPAMADTTAAVEQTPATAPTTNAAPAGVTLSDEQFEKLMARFAAPAPAMAAAESAPEAEKVEETKAPARTLTDADIAALAAAIHPPVAETVQPDVKPVEETKAEPVAEAAPAAQQAVDVQKAVAEGVKAAIPQILERFGVPSRHGYRSVSETDGSGKEISAQDLWDRRGDVWKDMIPDAPATVQPQPVQ